MSKKEGRWQDGGESEVFSIGARTLPGMFGLYHTLRVLDRE